MLDFDSNAIKNLTPSQKRHILLSGRGLFIFFALIIFLLGILIVLQGEAIWGMWFIVFAFFVVVLCCSRLLFYSDTRKNDFITAQLVQKAIQNEERHTGHAISNTERDKIQFQYDPLFQARIINHYEKDVETRYRKTISTLEHKLSKLEQTRTAEINRINAMRWQPLTHGLSYNLTTGQIRLSQQLILPFSALQQADIQLSSGTRQVRRPSRQLIIKNLHRKSAKLHDRLAERFTPTSDVETIFPSSTEPTKPTSTIFITRTITTRDQLSLIIKLQKHKNFTITFISKSLDQASKRFKQQHQIAKRLKHIIELLIDTPMPTDITPAEAMPSVIELDHLINEVRDELSRIKHEGFKFTIPDRYLAPTKQAQDQKIIATITSADEESDLIPTTPTTDNNPNTLNINALSQNLKKNCTDVTKDVK